MFSFENSEYCVDGSNTRRVWVRCKRRGFWYGALAMLEGDDAERMHESAKNADWPEVKKILLVTGNSFA